MLRTLTSKVAWVGRTASMVFGLALVLALVVGVTSMAFGANNQPFILGQNNAASLLTRLTGNVNGSAMQVQNINPDLNDQALNLKVQPGEAPMRVNSATRITNLNADKLDGRDSTQFAPPVLFARVNSDGSLNTVDSSHAESSFRSGEGVNIVNFDRDISNEPCVAIAEPQVQALTATFEGPSGGHASDTVIVHLYDSFVINGDRFVDGGFSVAVFCK